MIGIVVALKSEAKGIIDKTSAVEKTTKNGKKIYFGTVKKNNFVMIISGIGKVNAAFSTQYLIDNYPVDYIVNFGSVGAVFNKAEILNYYAVDKCCQYDFDLSALDGVPVGFIQDYDRVYFAPETDRLSFLPVAALASSDRFTEKAADIKTVSDLNCSLFDMEGGAIAQVCTANAIPYYVFKGITDVHGSGNDQNTFYENLQKVCDGFYDIFVKAFGN